MRRVDEQRREPPEHEQRDEEAVRLELERQVAGQRVPPDRDEEDDQDQRARAAAASRSTSTRVQRQRTSTSTASTAVADRRYAAQRRRSREQRQRAPTTSDGWNGRAGRIADAASAHGATPCVAWAARPRTRPASATLGLADDAAAGSRGGRRDRRSRTSRRGRRRSASSSSAAGRARPRSGARPVTITRGRPSGTLLARCSSLMYVVERRSRSAVRAGSRRGARSRSR